MRAAAAVLAASCAFRSSTAFHSAYAASVSTFGSSGKAVATRFIASEYQRKR
jgi:hypothetical protein